MLNKSNMKIKKVSIDYTQINLSVNETGEEAIQYNTISRLISRARLEDKPLIIVEGKDDINIYEHFVQMANVKATIRAIETIPGYSEGCTHVTRFIEEAQTEIKKTKENERFLLGIIDRDASYFRNEIKKRTKCLFVLKAYSFESHFVSEKHLEYSVKNFISSTASINNEIINYIYKGFLDKIEIYYYLSLEALRNACAKNYKGLLGYKVNYGYIDKNPDIITKVLLKKEKLDNYSKLRKIPHLDITIIKGKWLLDLFIETIYERIKSLSYHCSHNTLLNGQERCFFCESGIMNKCSWSPKKHHDKIILKNLVLQHFDENETSYIVDRIKMLGSAV
ncbi:hypothetical protein [Lysinibacillus fusiformis]|uniref:hypothetical protein n=1 Tax=Lysinibacillus fusiformis TaxID=28031 RepID=UPI0021BE9D89|nr:hypothetical protein [Lysinibacillus fusiformis]UXJ70792.1 hypothetical protein N5069_09715 [Lysinibacillus fusiformis]